MKHIRSAIENKTSKKHSIIGERFSFRLFSNENSPLWTNERKKIVVIGSGIGGMASASLFAKTGHQVNVLEMNNELIGGHARWHTIGGVKFSMGPQYVWEFGDGEAGDSFLKFLGIKNSNPFNLMESDGFERIFVGVRNEESDSYFLNFKVPLGLEKFKEKMTALFPEEKDKLSSLFNDMIGIYTAFKSFFKDNEDTEGRLLLAARFFLKESAPIPLKIKLGQTLFLSLKEWFDHYGISSLPRRIIYGHGGIFAESESEMSAIAFIVGTGNYHKGARYPVNGFHHFFNSMSSVIRENGGSVETGKKVISLRTENSLITKAVCEDGSEYPCDYIFSDISPRLTYHLLENEKCEFHYAPSHSIPVICIGIEKGLDSIRKMKGRNYWWQDGNEINYNDPDITAPPRMLYINSPTANGNSGLKENDKDALTVFCAGNYKQEKEIYAGGEAAIKLFKEKLANDVVSILDRNMFPGIKSKLLFVEVISSMDIEKATGCEMGSAYGRRMCVKEVLKGPIEEDGCPANLFNVSATKHSPGIAGGIYTAIKLFEELTGGKVQ
ncbi:MAG TPA: NAD(P)-binding protein [Spirochaetota bacterium]|mgnify:CR=1 FL=1|nr:NAD(P)-binding protein [Spirochaetota bacterium]